MVQLNILSGKMAGTQTVARRFPFHVGREAGADLRLSNAGVWDKHFRLDFKPAEGFILTAQGDALVTVNDQPVRETILRNGDLLGVGSTRLQFWLAETRQRGLRLREAFAWGSIALVTLAQLALLYFLL
jgi:pSer/pThr/pTyr-binding forkhead associated (FHA) protein